MFSFICLVASYPSMTGILMSIRIISGSASCAAVTACNPSSASMIRIFVSLKNAFRSIRFMLISSAIRMVLFSAIIVSPNNIASSAVRGNVPDTATSRSFTVKVLPCPGLLLSEISPFIISVRRLLIASPSPVPPYFRVLCPSDCVNDSNIFSVASGAIPIPVSSTSKSSVYHAELSCCILHFALSFTYPFSVNFSALPIRLNRTCLSRISSRSRLLGTRFEIFVTKSRFFSDIFRTKNCPISSKRC